MRVRGVRVYLLQLEGRYEIGITGDTSDTESVLSIRFDVTRDQADAFLGALEKFERLLVAFEPAIPAVGASARTVLEKFERLLVALERKPRWS